MKRQNLWVSCGMALGLALLMTTMTVLAGAPASARLPVPEEGTPGPAQAGIPAAACVRIEAGKVSWIVPGPEGGEDQVVQAYPRGVTRIHAVFPYSCIPANNTIVSVFTHEGQTVYTDREQLSPTDSKGEYDLGVHTKDDSPLEEGLWGVTFFNNKEKLTSGQVQVGGTTTTGGVSTSPTFTMTTPLDLGPRATVGVQGTVTDARTRKPIPGALVIVLNPGVTVQKYLDRGQSESDILTLGKSDPNGRYILEQPLQRNTSYSLLVVAKGYQPRGADGLLIDDTRPDPVMVNVALSAYQ